MTKERAMELLNNVIDYMSIAERNEVVIENLLHIGFTSDELVEDFGYSLTDVREVEKEMENDEE
jgi:predicted metallopeptidase